MNSELVWVICPVVAILSMLGGTYNKLFRRLGVPTIITLAAALFLGWSWWWPVLFLCIFGVTTLPFTLLKDSLQTSFINWVWIWIAGFLLGLPCAIITPKCWIFALVPSIFQGVLGTLSNLQFSAKYVPWKLVEGAVYFSMAFCYALSISLARI